MIAWNQWIIRADRKPGSHLSMNFDDREHNVVTSQDSVPVEQEAWNYHDCEYQVRVEYHHTW